MVGSPVAGSVLALNDLLAKAPHALLAQPYGGGWVARIVPDSWQRDQTVDGQRPLLPRQARRGAPFGRDFCFGGALLPAAAAG